MIAFVIQGQPCSKANSRELVTLKDGRQMSIKSKDALAYERAFLYQIPAAAKQMLKGPLRVDLRIYYSWNGPDLDESIILDCMQTTYAKGSKLVVRRGVYINDRQVRERHVYHFIDKLNPRAEIEVRPRVMQQQELELVLDMGDELETVAVPF